MSCCWRLVFFLASVSLAERGTLQLDDDLELDDDLADEAEINLIENSSQKDAHSWMLAGRMFGEALWGDWDQGWFKSLFPAIHERITATAWERCGLSLTDEKSTQKLLLRSLVAGARWNDQPTDFIGGDPEDAKGVKINAQGAAIWYIRFQTGWGEYGWLTKESHEGLLQHWHCQTPTPRQQPDQQPGLEWPQATMVLTNQEVADIMLAQAETWWQQSVELLYGEEPGERTAKSLFILGHMLHMLEDSFAPAHTIRSFNDLTGEGGGCGPLVHITGYMFQDHDKHKTLDYLTCENDDELCGCSGSGATKVCARDQRMRELYSCAVSAAQMVLAQWLRCNNGGRRTAEAREKFCEWGPVHEVVATVLYVDDRYQGMMAGGSETAVASGSAEDLGKMVAKIGQTVLQTTVDVSPCQDDDECRSVGGHFDVETRGCLVDIVVPVPDPSKSKPCGSHPCEDGQYCLKQGQPPTAVCLSYLDLVGSWNGKLSQLHLGEHLVRVQEEKGNQALVSMEGKLSSRVKRQINNVGVFNRMHAEGSDA